MFPIDVTLLAKRFSGNTLQKQTVSQRTQDILVAKTMFSCFLLSLARETFCSRFVRAVFYDSGGSMFLTICPHWEIRPKQANSSNTPNPHHSTEYK